MTLSGFATLPHLYLLIENSSKQMKPVKNGLSFVKTMSLFFLKVQSIWCSSSLCLWPTDSLSTKGKGASTKRRAFFIS